MKKINKLFLILTFVFSLPLFATDLKRINKSPRTLYLLKKANVDKDVGEPIVYPDRAQLKMLYSDDLFSKDRVHIESFDGID